MRRSLLLTLLPVLLAFSMVSPSAAGAAGTVLFDSVPAPLPGSVTSLPFHFGGNDEFGQILYPVETGTLGSITVTMVSVACQEGDFRTADCRTAFNPDGSPATFDHPVTVNLYAVGASTEPGAGPGPVIASVTQTLAIPYRPSSDSACPRGGYLPSCFGGYAFNATFDVSGLAVSVPAQVIATVTLNTETTGPAPTGVAGPYNFLAVGVGGPPSVGAYGDAYVDYDETDGLENNDMYDYTTLIRLESAPSSPGTAQDCKAGGFERFGFSNQGQCIASVKANENAAG